MTHDQLDIFFGDANNAEARVYARLEAAENPDDCRLAGRVIGPTCEYAHTLSAGIPLAMKRLPAGGAAPRRPPLLAEAVVPDPCFWSTELPFLYRVEVELWRAADLLATTSRLLGIRPLGALRWRLVFEAKSWVPRGIDRGEVPETELSQWRAADLVMVVERPSEELCGDASRLGVLLVAEVAGNPADLAAETRRLSRWPAVIIAMLSSNTPLAASIRASAGNLLLGQSFGAGTAIEPAAWADVVICESSDAADLSRRAATCNLPLIARRPAAWRDDLVQARFECDRLQRDLAGRGEFAGYFV
ncbi:MAG TPA: hypothetical protein VMV69_26565 [Pirellulales bacterium]|nr:hypothetical protein [Pirellulales bacterium]